MNEGPEWIQRRKRRWGNVLLIIFLALAVVGVALPYSNTALKMLLIGGSFCFWAGVILLYWNTLWIRILALLPAVLLGIVLLLPERHVDREALRRTYVDSLKSYEGTLYVWGGEHRTGIDCSGLTRRAFMDALVTEGIRQKEPSLLRSALSLWWNDASAQAMGEGHQGKTWKFATVPALNDADYTKLKPGDLAVTQGGTHILAYLGEENGKKTWIQANPIAWKVIHNTVPDTQDVYFGMEAKLIRWSRLP
jgi:hypothetical protein